MQGPNLTVDRREDNRRRRTGGTPRISDVATLAGVSIATVSRALSMPERVTDATRKRVLEAVEKTGYTPNLAARALRGARAQTALVVVPNLITPFFAELLQHIDHALSRRDYGLLIGNLDAHPDKERRLVDLSHAGRVDGALLLNGWILRGSNAAIGTGTLPAVALSTPFEQPIPSIMIDDVEGGRLAAKHLLELGHRRLAYVSGPVGNPVDSDRWDGFRESVLEGGRPTPDRFEGDFHIESGLRAARWFLDQDVRATAVFAASDEMAISCMSALKAAGLRVPADVSIIGFDGIAFANYVEPQLTTINQPQGTIAEAGVDLLMRLIDGESDIHSRKLKPVLSTGASTGPAAD